MEKECGVGKECGVEKEAVAAPKEATPTMTAPPPVPEKPEKCYKKTVAAPKEATPIMTAPPPVPEKPEKCYKKTVGEEATFLESAKDYFNQFKAMPAQKHWICVKNYFSHKCSSVFSKKKVEAVVKEETSELAKPAAVESH